MTAEPAVHSRRYEFAAPLKQALSVRFRPKADLEPIPSDGRPDDLGPHADL